MRDALQLTRDRLPRDTETLAAVEAKPCAHSLQDDGGFFDGGAVVDDLA